MIGSVDWNDSRVWRGLAEARDASREDAVVVIRANPGRGAPWWTFHARECVRGYDCWGELPTR
jgi:hypothetical protein